MCFCLHGSRAGYIYIGCDVSHTLHTERRSTRFRFPVQINERLRRAQGEEVNWKRVRNRKNAPRKSQRRGEPISKWVIDIRKKVWLNAVHPLPSPSNGRFPRRIWCAPEISAESEPVNGIVSLAKSKTRRRRWVRRCRTSTTWQPKFPRELGACELFTLEKCHGIKNSLTRTGLMTFNLHGTLLHRGLNLIKTAREYVTV
jgi:hypothetical protein